MRIKRNVIFNKAGGNASKNANSCKISLPSDAIKALNVNEEDRGVFLEVQEDKVIIRSGKMKRFENNGIEVEVGDFLRMADYDTLVNEMVYTDMYSNIDDKGDFFEISLAGTKIIDEELNEPNDRIVADVIVKLDKKEEYDTIDKLDEFMNNEADDFWNLEVEVLRIEEI